MSVLGAETISAQCWTTSAATAPPMQLKDLEESFEYRTRPPPILLGNCTGVNIRLKINATRCKPTYESLQAMDEFRRYQAAAAGTDEIESAFCAPSTATTRTTLRMVKALECPTASLTTMKCPIR